MRGWTSAPRWKWPICPAALRARAASVSCNSRACAGAGRAIAVAPPWSAPGMHAATLTGPGGSAARVCPVFRTMTLTQSLLVIGLRIAASAFFSMAGISLAAARRLRLRQMADEGDARADRVLRLQEQPGDYVTVVQVGQNAVAILGGIVGEGALSPHFAALAGLWLSDGHAQTVGFLASFLVITSLFILFSDLFPKRLGMAEPENLVVRLAQPMVFLMTVL